MQNKIVNLNNEWMLKTFTLATIFTPSSGFGLRAPLRSERREKKMIYDFKKIIHFFGELKFDQSGPFDQ